MHKTKIKNIETGIEKNCDILKKNNDFMEVVIENTTIKLILKKKINITLESIKKWSLFLRETKLFFNNVHFIFNIFFYFP